MKSIEINKKIVISILSKGGSVKREDCNPPLLAQATWDAYERGFLRARELDCEIIEWLQINSRFLSISGIEQYLKMPNSTLTKAVNGSQNLPKKWKEPLQNFLIGLQNPKSVGNFKY